MIFTRLKGNLSTQEVVAKVIDGCSISVDTIPFSIPFSWPEGDISLVGLGTVCTISCHEVVTLKSFRNWAEIG